MAVNAFFDRKYVGQIATNHGWAGVTRWADGLPYGRYTALKHLAQHGYSTKFDDVVKDINEALKAKPPVEMGVSDTISDVKDLIASHPPGARLFSIS